MKWLMRDVAWVLGIPVAAALLARLLLPAEGLGTPGWGRRKLVVVTGALAFSAVLAVYAAVTERARLAGWLRPTPRGLGLGLAGGAALILLGAGSEAALRAAGIEVPDLAGELIRALPRWLLVVIVVLLAPVGEELYFRGRLYDALAARFGTPRAALATSAAFALLHAIPVLLPVYLLYGLALVALRHLSGGLVAPILAHLINNLIGLLATD